MAKARSLSARISSRAGFPDDTLGGVSCVSVYGKDKATLEECEAVIECSESMISARVCDGVVHIFGDGLIPVDFRLKTLSVCGRISKIAFEENEEKERERKA